MILKMMAVGPLQCNCILLGCEATREAVIIDPGDEAERLVAEVQSHGMQVKYLLHTHAHFDHVGATGALKAEWGSIPCLHRKDEPLYQMLPVQGRLFGMQIDPGPAIEKFIEDDEELSFGKHRLKVIHTPGHSPGSVCFRLMDGAAPLFSGDTLFYRSIGRTDLWGGDSGAILKSIKERLFTLDDDLMVYPGHGPVTHLGEEKRQNPFLT